MTLDEDALDLERARAERKGLLAVQASKPFDSVSEACLDCLPASVATELRPILRQPTTKIGGMNPLGFSVAARQILLKALVDVFRARTAVKLASTSIADLGSPSTIIAIEARLRPSSLTAKEGFGPIRASMLLAQVRKLMNFVHGACHPEIGRQQQKWLAEPRRSVDHRVATPEEYVTTAYALGAIARILREDERVWGKTLQRDAALLALNANAHARRSELNRINVGDVTSRVAKGKRVLCVTLTMTKTRETRIVHLHDPRVIELVSPLLRREGSAPLFTGDGKRLGSGGIHRVLVRMGVRTKGEPGSCNIMRKSSTLRRDGKRVRSSRKLGHTGDKTADDYYTPSRRELGLRLLREANERSASQAREFRKRRL